MQRFPARGSVSLTGGFEAGRIYDLLYTPAECPVVGAGTPRDARPRGVDAAKRRLARRRPRRPRDRERGLAVRPAPADLPPRRPQPGRGGGAGVRRGARPCRGRAARRVQPPLRAALGAADPEPRAPLPVRRRAPGRPALGRREGLLDRLRAAGCVPKIVYTDTSSEYWRGDAGLTHRDLGSGADPGTDPGADRGTDVEPPAEVRRYLFAGTQHGPGVLPFTDRSMFGSRGANRFNAVDYRPLLRAALENLRAWIADGVEPPASVFPRGREATAASREEGAGRARGGPRVRAGAFGPAPLARAHGPRGARRPGRSRPPRPVRGRAVPVIGLRRRRGRQRDGRGPHAGRERPGRDPCRLQPAAPRERRRRPDSRVSRIDDPARPHRGGGARPPTTRALPSPSATRAGTRTSPRCGRRRNVSSRAGTCSPSTSISASRSPANATTRSPVPTPERPAANAPRDPIGGLGSGLDRGLDPALEAAVVTWNWEARGPARAARRAGPAGRCRRSRTA